MCSDWERALSLHIQQRQFEEALTLLGGLLSGELRVEQDGFSRSSSEWEGDAERILEKFSPQLMLSAPAQLVDIWMHAPYLDPSKLLPAIMSYDCRYDQRGDRRESDAGSAATPGKGRLTHQGIRYLQHCVDQNGCEQQVACGGDGWCVAGDGWCVAGGGQCVAGGGWYVGAVGGVLRAGRGVLHAVGGV